MSKRLDWDDRSRRLRIVCEYDPDLLPVLRRLPGRSWNPQQREWTVPEAHAAEVINRLQPLGFSPTTALTRHLEGGDGATLFESVDSPAEVTASTRSLQSVSRSVERLSDESRPEPSTEVEAEAERVYTVYALNEVVRGVLRRQLPKPIWLIGEVIGFERNAHKRTIYFQLVEKDLDGSRPRASVTAVIFDRVRSRLVEQLREANLSLKDGLEIKVRARVDLYPNTGSYQVIVEDIDPSFTVGQLLQNRERILHELQKRGVLDLNLNRAFPRPCLRLALLTSFQSDAYNDFVAELKRSSYPFSVQVFDIHVQGDRLERELLTALNGIARRRDEFDLVILVRGGGSRTDLMGFDSLSIAAAFATLPVKAVVGIGHQRDQSILDAVCHSEKTPTAAAKLIVELLRAELDQLAQFGVQLNELSKEALKRTRGVIEMRSKLFVRSSQLRLSRLQSQLDSSAQRLGERSRVRLLIDSENIRRSSLFLSTLSRSALSWARQRLQSQSERLAHIPETIKRERERLESHRQRLEGFRPERLLRRGLAEIRRGDRRVRSVEQVEVGDEIRVQLHDGALEARVTGRRPAT